MEQSGSGYTLAHTVFSFPNPPSSWTKEVPEVIKDTGVRYEMSARFRTPTSYIK